MAQEKIIIKFEPKGHPELIAAIKKLNVETKKLTGSTVTVATATKGSTAATKQAAVATSLLGTGTKRLAKNNTMLANSFATLRSKLLLISFGAMLIERAFVSLVKAYGQQEAANKKLQAGLANIADTTPGVTQRLIDYSAALQQTTAFGDEMITTGMVQLTTFGLNEEAIKALTPQILNVARGIQTVSGAMPDLNSLFIAFGKATTTGIGTLTRYGVVLTETERAQLGNMNANESAVEIAKILDRQYGGLTEAYAKTTAGMLEATDLARGDAAEALGEVLAPAVVAVAKGLKIMFEAMNVENIKQYGLGMIIAAGATTTLAIATGKLNLALVFTRKAMIRTGIGALVVIAGLLTGKLLDMFGVFKDGEGVLDDAGKKLRDFNKALEEDKRLADELKEAREKSVESLENQLNLLNAKTEVDKMLIQLGHEASDVELELIRNIVAKTEALKIEQELKKNDIRLTRESLDLQDRINLLSMEANNANEIDLALTQEQLRFNKEIAELRGADSGGVIIWSEAQLIKLDLLKEEHRLLMLLIKAGKAKENVIANEIGAMGQLMGAFSDLAATNKGGAIQSMELAKLAAVASAIAGSMKAFEKGGIAGFLTGTALLVSGLARVKQIDAAIAEAKAAPKLAQGGLIGGRRHSQGGTMINAESGEFVMSRNAVESVGIENLNRMNQGGGGAVTVNVSGNVLTEDFVTGELAENIKEAVRRGTDFGIS